MLQLTIMNKVQATYSLLVVSSFLIFIYACLFHCVCGGCKKMSVNKLSSERQEDCMAKNTCIRQLGQEMGHEIPACQI